MKGGNDIHKGTASGEKSVVFVVMENPRLLVLNYILSCFGGERSLNTFWLDPAPPPQPLRCMCSCTQSPCGNQQLINLKKIESFHHLDKRLAFSGSNEYFTRAMMS